MVKFLSIVLSLSLATFVVCSTEYVLYPIESESRELRTLHGLWNFKISPLSDQSIGFDKKWYTERFEMVCKCKKITNCYLSKCF